MKNRPQYSISSVDGALLLATLLQHEGPLRVTDAAQRLDVSVSTAHRLLAMLVYRDFAVQMSDKRYGPGPLMRRHDLPQHTLARLSAVGARHLRQLVDQLGETATLMVLTHTDVRFLSTVECDLALRVGDRTGRTLPAHLSSGGKAMIAAATPSVREMVMAGLDESAARRLARELHVIQRLGYALNLQETEKGLVALGVAIPSTGSDVSAAISVALPSVRWSRDVLPTWSSALTRTAGSIARELVET